MAQDADKTEDDYEDDIISVEDSYSSDDANLARIKKKDSYPKQLPQDDEDSDYSQEPFETEENGSALRK